jgi:hypothetical protein
MGEFACHYYLSFLQRVSSRISSVILMVFYRLCLGYRSWRQWTDRNNPNCDWFPFEEFGWVRVSLSFFLAKSALVNALWLYWFVLTVFIELLRRASNMLNGPIPSVIGDLSSLDEFACVYRFPCPQTELSWIHCDSYGLFSVCAVYLLLEINKLTGNWDWHPFEFGWVRVPLTSSSQRVPSGIPCDCNVGFDCLCSGSISFREWTDWNDTWRSFQLSEFVGRDVPLSFFCSDFPLVADCTF